VIARLGIAPERVVNLVGEGKRIAKRI